MILIIGGNAPTIYISDLSLHGRPIDIIANHERKTAESLLALCCPNQFFPFAASSQFSLIAETV
jgi:preprotein translocase subunit SecB